MPPNPSGPINEATEAAVIPPEPLPTRLPAWFWSVVLGAVSLVCAAGWFLTHSAPLLWGLVPYTMIGNSLLMVPYDWYLPAVVQHQPAILVVVIATAATVLIEFWNMDVLARLLSRKGTAALRGHTVTTRLLGWYQKAPWWTLVVGCFVPLIPFYPCRFLATLAHYPIWRYQTAIVLGRGVRYTALAGAGLLLPIPPAAYFALGASLLLLFVVKYLRQRRAGQRS